MAKNKANTKSTKEAKKGEGVERTSRRTQPDLDTVIEETMRSYAKTVHGSAYKNSVHPKVACKKCGMHLWVADREPLAWSCNHCGNMVFFTYGSLRQQIENVCNSGRKGEFVKNLKGNYEARANEDLKRIHFRDHIEKLQRKKKAQAL